jgi:hypothetical protein
MHDIGRTQLETTNEYHELGEFETGEASGYGELEFESGEFESGEVGEFESPLSEAQEMELASELLEIASEQELEQFLGDVARAVGGAAMRLARSDAGRQLGGILKDTLSSAAKQALPVVGRAIGGAVDPRYADFGGRAGAAVGDLLGLELEGLSRQDQEFETARQLTRFVATALRQAALAPRGAPPAGVARTAVARAARLYLPGYYPRLRGRSGRSWGRSGRWVRRGRTIVLYGM